MSAPDQHQRERDYAHHVVALVRRCARVLRAVGLSMEQQTRYDGLRPLVKRLVEHLNAEAAALEGEAGKL